MTRFFTGISVIGLIAGGVSIGQAQTLPEQVALPKNIHVLDAGMRPAVIELLAVSPTFKRQCDTIGATPNVHVTIGNPVVPLSKLNRSRLTLRRYDTGLLAFIELPALARADVLAYDLEYVIGQLQQVPGQGRAAETSRAHAAQRAARNEYRRSDSETRALARGIQ